ncbi:hypothetical protein F5J12DRAFT_781673 [Pisolithus orientalis]|uniref:uncharacterized protein n=1 Tax=Pisolithus orientalis TaxID=936130 RepID=UPI002224FBD7|nr:uncharacterized protein F5J12DRAFT_781673 [Pisolithus orientalis]KAI6012821.1 hypothetical protein F5J12DRAFT_781673 [Pisolithus orientalis]
MHGLFEGLAKEVKQVQGMLGASPTKHQGLGALDGSQRLGAFKSCLDETPSHGGATSYSATWGIEDCQLSLATLESIFYFQNETQLFMGHPIVLWKGGWDVPQQLLKLSWDIPLASREGVGCPTVASKAIMGPPTGLQKWGVGCPIIASWLFYIDDLDEHVTKGETEPALSWVLTLWFNH